VVSICVYLILHYLDDQRTKRQQIPPSSFGTKMILFFFSLIITTILFHFFWKESIVQSGGETLDVKKTYLSKIDQDVYVGLPDF
jgi:hypothetical protein